MSKDARMQIEQFLQQHHYKLTELRKKVIRILNESDKPLSFVDTRAE